MKDAKNVERLSVLSGRALRGCNKYIFAGLRFTGCTPSFPLGFAGILGLTPVGVARHVKRGFAYNWLNAEVALSLLREIVLRL